MGRFVFKLPDVGEGTAEAELVAWHVKVGDMVEEDQLLVDVMTDKATVELTSPVSGKVTALHGEPGVQSAVGSALVEFEVEGAGNASAEPEAASPSTASRSPSPQGGEEKAASPPHEMGRGTTEGGGGAASAAPLAGNYVFKLPDVGEGTAEAELVAWHVAVGDAVEEDQLLAEVMTDKATVELTSPVAGVVAALHGQPGQQIAVGGPLVGFDVEGKGNVTAPAQSAPLSLEGRGAGGEGDSASRPNTVNKTPASSTASTASTTVTPPPPHPSPIKGEGL